MYTTFSVTVFCYNSGYKQHQSQQKKKKTRLKEIDILQKLMVSTHVDSFQLKQ